MNNKIKNIVLVTLMAAFLFGMALFSWFRAPDTYSDSERRVLAAFPRLSAENILSGRFMKDFEGYTQDQFPARERFRALKAAAAFYGLRQLDNNGLYISDGYISKLDPVWNESMTAHAAERFGFVYDSYLKDSGAKVYFSIVPDKNYFLAELNARPALDYEALAGALRSELEYMEYVDIFPLLEIEDYYRTDSHWRQERIIPVADRLLEAMGAPLPLRDYSVNTLEEPFYGVYSGQIALPQKPDSLSWLTNETLEGCTVTSYNTGKAQPAQMYNMEKATGKDAKDMYELFLSGNDALITVENPAAESDRELIIFRDSFGSSIAPLFAESYAKLTVVDLRYINCSMLGNFIDFENQDVLFLYSTMLLNNSLGIR